VAYAPDGKRIATGGWDGATRVWNLGADQPSIELVSRPCYVFAVAFSPDGQRLAVGTSDNQAYVQIWDLSTGKIVRTLQGHDDAAVSVVFSHNGEQLLTSSYDETARVGHCR